jgi:hypothetical protein
MTDPARAPRICLFAGPSLPPGTGRSITIDGLDVLLLPPVRQGDVLRALRHRPTLIAVLDGAAPPAASVSHKEILYAMEQGVRMLGAAGIGAIRAAELAETGMDGLGEIYRWYRHGNVDADDEVALCYHPSTFTPLTVPMVNLRHQVRRARASAIISPATAHATLSHARRIHFGERTTEAILTGVATQLGPAEVDTLRGFLDAHPEDLNRLDASAALAALATLATETGTPGTGLLSAPPRVHCRPTVFLRQLQHAHLPAPGAVGEPPGPD